MSGDFESEEHQGIIPRSVDLIFETLEKYKIDGVLTSDTSVAMSCVELHCETLQDLLNPDNKSTQIIQNG